GALPPTARVGVDATVLAFTLLVSFVTGLLFGLAPALQTLKLSVTEALKEGGRDANEGAYRNRTRSLLVVLESAVAVVLLIGAGLLIRSFFELRQVRPGFDPENVLTLRIDLARQKYSPPGRSASFFDELESRVANLPGVEAVGMVSELPLSGQPNDMPFTVEGRPPVTIDQAFDADYRRVNKDYFTAMRIPVLRGRPFTEQDVRQSAKVLLVSDLFARQVFPDEEAIGKRLIFAIGPTDPWEIIGIVEDVRHRGIEVAPFATMYLPSRDIGRTNLVIRTKDKPAGIAPLVRLAVQAMDSDQPVASVRTMDDWVYSAAAAPRYRTTLLALFATMALVLAAVGIYGVVSYTVSQRTHEVGVRVALGARRSDVLKLIVGRGMALVAAGVAAGIAAGFGLTRLMSAFLFGVSPSDPLTFAAVAVSLLAVALVACYVPALRATRVDPMKALRFE
ncbi:MAG TPA: FtsX-like permease family protein, partial [Blastocatellia bacterium]|nr:FtsX-like permease family protein [Blastocatellia bacterium]